MGIKAKFTKEQVHTALANRLKNIEKVILNQLMLIGERFVKNARENHTYLDQTGNLTSSISYIVLNNGKRVAESFISSKVGTDKLTGIEVAESFIDEIAANFQTGYVLIVVAGMDYAAAVESKGRDVLTASSIKAKSDLKKAVSDIKKMVKNS